MELSGAVLRDVAHGNAPETVRVLRPRPTLAFARLERTRAGFPEPSS